MAAALVGTAALALVAGLAAGSGPPPRRADPVSTGPQRPAPADPLAALPALESAPAIGAPGCTGTTISITDADAVLLGNTRQEVFVVRTTGPDCQFQGYPRMTFLTATGATVAVRLDHGGHGLAPGLPGAVTLSAGTSVSFAVATTRTGRCTQPNAARISLPGMPGTLTVATTMTLCGGAAGISPLQRTAPQDG